MRRDSLAEDKLFLLLGLNSLFRVELRKVTSPDEEECCSAVPVTSATVDHLGKPVHLSEAQFPYHAQRSSDSVSGQSVKANLFFTFKKSVETVNVSFGVKIHAEMDL